MIIETVKQLMDEYKKRMEHRIVHCGDCNLTFNRHGAQRIYKINTGHEVTFIPGTNYDTLPSGWHEAECVCGKVFPGIEFEDVECSCKKCKERKLKERQKTMEELINTTADDGVVAPAITDTDEFVKKSAAIYEWLDFLTMSIKEKKRAVSDTLALGQSVRCYAGENNFIIKLETNNERKEAV